MGGPDKFDMALNISNSGAWQSGWKLVAAPVAA